MSAGLGLGAFSPFPANEVVGRGMERSFKRKEKDLDSLEKSCFNPVPSWNCHRDLGGNQKAPHFLPPFGEVGLLSKGVFYSIKRARSAPFAE